MSPNEKIQPRGVGFFVSAQAWQYGQSRKSLLCRHGATGFYEKKEFSAIYEYISGFSTPIYGRFLYNSSKSKPKPTTNSLGISKPT